MKIVVIAGPGLIGTKLPKNLSERGQDAVAAFSNTGVNTIICEGLAKALDVADMANAPVRKEKAVLESLET